MRQTRLDLTDLGSFVCQKGARFFVFHWQAVFYEFLRWVCLVKFIFFEKQKTSAIEWMVGKDGSARWGARRISKGSTPMDRDKRTSRPAG